GREGTIVGEGQAQGRQGDTHEEKSGTPPTHRSPPGEYVERSCGLRREAGRSGQCLITRLPGGCEKATTIPRNRSANGATAAPRLCEPLMTWNQVLAGPGGIETPVGSCRGSQPEVSLN